jgi:hypothetical protein
MSFTKLKYLFSDFFTYYVMKVGDFLMFSIKISNFIFKQKIASIIFIEIISTMPRHSSIIKGRLNKNGMKYVFDFK